MEYCNPVSPKSPNWKGLNPFCEWDPRSPSFPRLESRGNSIHLHISTRSHTIPTPHTVSRSHGLTHAHTSFGRRSHWIGMKFNSISEGDSPPFHGFKAVAIQYACSFPPSHTCPHLSRSHVLTLSHIPTPLTILRSYVLTFRCILHPWLCPHTPPPIPG